MNEHQIHDVVLLLEIKFILISISLIKFKNQNFIIHVLKSFGISCI